jgi:hypothetical protein
MTLHNSSTFTRGPLPTGEIELFTERDCLPSNPPPASAAEKIAGTTESLQPLTAVQSRIWAALTRRPLNERQLAVLEIYFRARLAREAPLSVEEAGRRAAEALGLPRKRARDYLRGSLRSFGRRLAKTRKVSPPRTDQDNSSNAAAGSVPLLAMMSIETGPRGESRHRLTYDGMVAVATALGFNGRGIGATSASKGDPALDDLDVVVTIAMSRASAALLLRIQNALRLSLDATICALAAQAGAS